MLRGGEDGIVPNPLSGPSDEDRRREAAKREHWEQSRVNSFEVELRTLINRHSIDDYAETPDYLLARYLRHCLDSYVEVSHWTKKWRE